MNRQEQFGIVITPDMVSCYPFVLMTNNNNDGHFRLAIDEGHIKQISDHTSICCTIGHAIKSYPEYKDMLYALDHYAQNAYNPDERLFTL